MGLSRSHLFCLKDICLTRPPYSQNHQLVEPYLQLCCLRNCSSRRPLQSSCFGRITLKSIQKSNLTGNITRENLPSSLFWLLIQVNTDLIKLRVRMSWNGVLLNLPGVGDFVRIWPMNPDLLHECKTLPTFERFICLVDKGDKLSLDGDVLDQPGSN